MAKKIPEKNHEIKKGDLVHWYETDPHGDIVLDAGIGIVVDTFKGGYGWTYQVHQQNTNKVFWFMENEVRLYST